MYVVVSRVFLMSWCAVRMGERTGEMVGGETSFRERGMSGVDTCGEGMAGRLRFVPSRQCRGC